MEEGESRKIPGNFLAGVGLGALAGRVLCRGDGGSVEHGNINGFELLPELALELAAQAGEHGARGPRPGAPCLEESGEDHVWFLLVDGHDDLESGGNVQAIHEGLAIAVEVAEHEEGCVLATPASALEVVGKCC